MKVWIVKYALTKGLYAEDVEPCFDINPSMVVKRNGHSMSEHFHRGDWFESKSEAIDAAEDMRDRKIKSLRKSLAKLESLEFA